MMIIGGPSNQGGGLMVRAPRGKKEKPRRVTLSPLVDNPDSCLSSEDNIMPVISFPGVHGTQMTSGFQSISDGEQRMGGFLSVAESE